VNVLEMVVITIIAVGENEGDSQNQENDTGNERHFEREPKRRKGYVSWATSLRRRKEKIDGGCFQPTNALYTSPEHRVGVSDVHQRFERTRLLYCGYQVET